MKKITLFALILSALIFSCSKNEESSTGRFLIVQSGSCFTGSPKITNTENDNMTAKFKDASGNTVDFTPKPNTWYSGPSGLTFNFGSSPKRINGSVFLDLSIEGKEDPCK
jgi:hypothetical protein